MLYLINTENIGVWEEINKLIPPKLGVTKGGKVHTYKIYYNRLCIQCKNKIECISTKTEFRKIIKNLRNNEDIKLCENCKIINKKDRKIGEINILKETLKIEKEKRRKKEERIKKYVETFLTPNKSLYNMPFEEKVRLLKSDFTIDKQLICEKIKIMSYKNFLLTQYWKIIREMVIRKFNGLCAICANATRLEVHHRRYTHIHGFELYYWETELLPLCRECHQAITKI